jgi:hypothetical protein
MMTSSIGSSTLAVLLAQHDARTADGELEAFAAHVFDQHGELQFAAAGDVEGVVVGAFGDADGDVALGLAQQALADDADCTLSPSRAGERAVIDAEGDRQGRRIDRLGPDRGVTDGSHQVSATVEVLRGRQWRRCRRLALVDRLALEAAEGEHLGDAALLDDLAVAAERTLTTGRRLDRARGEMRPVSTRPRKGCARWW